MVKDWDRREEPKKPIACITYYSDLTSGAVKEFYIWSPKRRSFLLKFIDRFLPLSFRRLVVDSSGLEGSSDSLWFFFYMLG